MNRSAKKEFLSSHRTPFMILLSSGPVFNTDKLAQMALRRSPHAHSIGARFGHFFCCPSRLRAHLLRAPVRLGPLKLLLKIRTGSRPGRCAPCQNTSLGADHDNTCRCVLRSQTGDMSSERWHRRAGGKQEKGPCFELRCHNCCCTKCLIQNLGRTHHGKV